LRSINPFISFTYKQGATAVLQAKKLTLSPPFRLALTECFALLLQRSTTLGIFTLAKDMQVRFLNCLMA
jgi:hypothetical protein